MTDNRFVVDDEVWRRFASGAKVEAVDDDTGELVLIDPRGDDPDDIEGVLVGFDYEDAGGQPSVRMCLGHRVWYGNSNIYLRGLCPIRQALRTFRADRMTRLVELRSRRPMPDPQSFLAGFLVGRDREYWASVNKWREARAERETFVALRSHCRSGLRVLAYVAMSDGARSDAEAEIEKRYLIGRAKQIDFQLSDSVLQDLTAFGQSLAPTREQFLADVRAIAEDSQHLAEVATAALDLARHDGIDIDEAKALQLLIATARRKRAKIAASSA
jgi:hypothetical protein